MKLNINFFLKEILNFFIYSVFSFFIVLIPFCAFVYLLLTLMLYTNILLPHIFLQYLETIAIIVIFLLSSTILAFCPKLYEIIEKHLSFYHKHNKD